MTRNMVFLHGLISSSLAYKASVIRKSFPKLIVPDFTGSLENRLETLSPILEGEKDWTIIGSSLGGLMGAIFTCEHPDQVEKLVMLAPSLMLPQFASYVDALNSPSKKCKPVSAPTTIIHGTQDRIVPLEEVCGIAQKVFTNLTYKIVDDDHGLHKTADAIDWKTLLE